MSSRHKHTNHTPMHTQAEINTLILTCIRGQQPQSSHSHFRDMKTNGSNGLSLTFNGLSLTFTSASDPLAPLLSLQLLATQTPINAHMERPLVGTTESRDQLTPSYTQDQESSCRLELERNLMAMTNVFDQAQGIVRQAH